MRLGENTPETLAVITLIIVIVLFATGRIYPGNPGPSAEEQAQHNNAVATATVRALQTHARP